MSFENKNKVVTRLAGAAIVVMAAANTPAFAQTAVVMIAAAVGPTSTSDERVVTVSNTGSKTLRLGAPEFPRSFVKGGPVARECAETLAPGDTCEIAIRFEPTEIGLQTGKLTLTTGDPQQPQLVVTLSGTGIAPPERRGDPDDRGDRDDHKDHDTRDSK
jgi:HYDIN/CFA65/VesB-like, Ig-like domain